MMSRRATWQWGHRRAPAANMLGWLALVALTSHCQPLPTAEQFAYGDAKTADGDVGEKAPSCGDGLCNSAESLDSCVQDCGGPNRHLANACNSPGTTAGCPSGYICIARSFSGGGPVCVADFATWPQLPGGHPEGSFVAHPASTTDLLTGLTWATRISSPVMETDAALLCSQAKDEGLRDWRLPTRAELHSLVDYNRQGVMSVAPGFEWNPGTYCHWSASKAADGWGSWVVNLDGGKSMTYGSQYTCVTRCVRGQPGFAQLRADAERYAALPGGDVILDRQTGLQWRRQPPAQTRRYADAWIYCQGLRLQQANSSWRLPNIRELLELVDLRRSDPTLHPLFAMPVDGEKWFHSGSLVVPHVANWLVHFGNGHHIGMEAPPDALFHTRCVQ